MASLGAVIDFECGKLLLTVNRKLHQVYSVPPTGHKALTIFSDNKACRSHQVRKQEARRMDEQVSASPRPEITMQESKSWLVRYTDYVTVAPRFRQIILGRLESEKEQKFRTLVCVEPAQIPIDGVLSVHGLSRVGSMANEPSRVTSEHDHTVAGARNSCAYVMVANFNNEELTIPKATVLGVAEEISEALLDMINAGNRSNLGSPTNQQRKRRNKALYQKLLQGKLDHLSEKERKSIEPVLLEYAHVFHDKKTNDFKGTDVVELQILVGFAQPIRRLQHRVPCPQRGGMKAQVKKMLDMGVIRESNSPWSAPAIRVPMKARKGNQNLGFVSIFQLLIL